MKGATDFMRAGLSILAIMMAATAAAADTVHAVDGLTFRGAVTISVDGVRVVDSEGPTDIALGDVARIELDAGPTGRVDLMDRPAQTVLETTAGERLAVSRIRLSGQTVTMEHERLKTLSLPLSAVATVYLPAGEQTPGGVLKTCEEMALTDGGSEDRLLLVGAGGKTASASGVLRGITPTDESGAGGAVTFVLGGQEREIAVEKVRAILLASAGSEPPASAGQLRLTDGTVLGFDQIEMDGQTVRIQSPRLGSIEIAREAASGMSFRSDRFVYLDTLTPAAVTEFGLLDWTLSHRLNRAVSGRPMRLDGATSERGLGLRSFCELSYDLSEPFAWFVATVGIDDGARPRGDATLTILGDGSVLGEPIPLRGDESARLLRLDVTGVKRLTIRVDFGEDGLDVADHVDLAEARLIR